ncbi:thioredoxin-like protein [Conidiobolus coronatus NRRL 28638]|uniref:Thioredoxin-like protein n=1 Tax=Conidiobolus coronatus (strain ATCC 28846 / CBS 209.66 / NRRL 28638) TaxID=796925 RepID=A0A137P818_CONC2|nr:thioredoxin-like protein [Conidiobolus coronatus NRRL 28638]|eukprot:KXN71119.1 thioredoxin-like protein [Conidiobolus coronatus NRRL 28638]
MNPNPNEDTEWNDILRDKGILPPKGPSDLEILEQAIEEAVEAKAAQESSRFEGLDLDELDELEDLEDDRILLAYRQQRIAEMQAEALRSKFGEVYHISKPDFVKEVTEASKENAVIVHLYKDSYEACTLLNEYLNNLAKKYKFIKICKIISDMCIENYPDKNVPTLIIYNNGEPVQQLAGLRLANGDLKLKEKDIEKILSGLKIIDLPELD